MSRIVLMSDAVVEGLPVVECGEPLVDLRGQFLVDERKRDEAGDWAHVRFGLAQQLLVAEEQLHARGLRLLIVEGYRPPALQETYFGEYMAELRAQHPEWDVKQLRDATARFVAPPETAGHATGGAIDLTLADTEGREVDMGCRVNASPEESEGLCYLHASGLPGEARANRTILRNLLVGAGLINYPTEFWHWSLGDKYACATTGEEHAWYGPYDRSS